MSGPYTTEKIKDHSKSLIYEDTGNGLKRLDDAAFTILSDGRLLKCETTGDKIISTVGIYEDASGNVGLGTLTPTSPFELEKDQNAVTTLEVDNNTSGTAAAAELLVRANAGQMYFRAFSSGYTTSGQKIADGGLLQTESLSGGLSLSAFGAYEIMLWTDSNKRVTVDASGNVGINDASPGYTLEVNGDSHVTGEFTAGTKTFKIDHPLNPTEKILTHATVEAPRHDLIYRGIAKLKNGRVVVNIDIASNMSPGTFEALCQNIVVTSLQNQDGFDRVKPGAVFGASFEIICEDAASNENVAWVVMAERKDPLVKWSDQNDEDGHLIVEKEKVNPTKEELDELKDCHMTIEDDDEERTETTNVDCLSEKKGYLMHPKCRGQERPTRTVHYKKD